MMQQLFLSVLLCLTATGAALGAEYSLDSWALVNKNMQKHPDYAVTAYYKRVKGRDLLAFKLTNLSKKPLALDASLLPWGNNASCITLTAITTDGQRLPNLHPFEAPPLQAKITLAPGASRQGNYDLAHQLQLAKAPKGKDILVLWSYEPSNEGNLSMANRAKEGRAECTGVVVIPRAEEPIITG